MPVPPHRAGVVAILEAAGYRNSEHHLPTYPSGGTFSVIGAQAVEVTVRWWSASPEEVAGKLREMADVLRDEGLRVEERRGKLYVPAPIGRD